MRKILIYFFAIAATLILTGLIFSSAILTFLGKTLIYEDKPSKCDAAVILTGEFPERALASADLYNLGLVKYLIVPKNAKSAGVKELKKRNIPILTENELIPKLLKIMKVPDEALIHPSNATERTIEEALEVKKIIDEKPEIKCLAIVTSRFHSKRAFVIFNQVLKKEEIEIKSFTPTFDDYDPKNWWTKPTYFRNVINEYLKFLLVPFNKTRSGEE